MIIRMAFAGAALAVLSGPGWAQDVQTSPFGQQNRSGASVLMTESKAIEAANLIRRGRVVPLGRKLTQDIPLLPGQRFTITDTQSSVRNTDEAIFVEQTMNASLGHIGTYLSGLSHIGSNGEAGQFYNGLKPSDTKDKNNVPDITEVKPFFTRGIMIDMVSLRGAPMEAGDEITPKDVETALDWQGVDPPGRGDVVLFHTGWGRNWSNGADIYHNGTPGIGLDLAAWLVDHGVALVGVDSWSVAVQSQETAPRYPVHLFLLKDNGIFLQQNLETERIIDAEISEFAYIFAPLKISGGSGGPGVPLAVY